MHRHMAEHRLLSALKATEGRAKVSFERLIQQVSDKQEVDRCAI